jgi:phage tail sheath protein FI
MLAYDTPGVYYRRADATAPAIAALRTDVAGFVGIATRGLVDRAMPVESWRQFEAHYGGFTGSGYLGYAVRAFFENGGRRCWVVRVASNDPSGGAQAAEAALRSATIDFFTVQASSPGVWGNDLTFEWRETHQAQALIPPHWRNPSLSLVNSVTGFERGTLVCLRQPGVARLRVVSDVDAVRSTLVWYNSRPDLRLRYEAPLDGMDPDLPISVESIEYSLAIRERGTPIAVYRGLTLIPEHSGYAPRQLPPLDVRRSAVEQQAVLPPTPEPVTIVDLRDTFQQLNLETLANASGPLRGGADGLMLLETSDFTGSEPPPLPTPLEAAQHIRGFHALDSIEEISIVAVPDIHIRPYALPPIAPPVCVPDPCLPGPEVLAPPLPPSQGDLPPQFSDEQVYAVEAALVEHCELLGDRIALLDPPFSASRNDALGIGAVLAWRSRFDSSYAALYYPWISVVDPLRRASGVNRDIPPSGHAAGLLARTDLDGGVHKAPANAALVWAQDTTVPVNEVRHGLLNTAGVNAIRPVAGRGIRVLGARTVSSDANWRFLNVRRLLLMIRKALYLSVQWAVFEPNNAITRSKLRLAIVSFLLALWQKGALMGDTAEAAFRVKCGDENNPQADRDAGRMLAQILVAPSQPFEFVEVRVGREGNEFEIQEASLLEEAH